MTTETNAERLERISNTDKYMYDRSGKHVTVNAQDFNFLVQQAERTQELETVQLGQQVVVRSLRNKSARLRKSLEFYADEDKWDEVNLSESPWNPYYVREIHKDRGETARQALNTQEDSQ